jgi:hypothetical protein
VGANATNPPASSHNWQVNTGFAAASRDLGREVVKIERELVHFFYPVVAGVTVLVAVIVCDKLESPQLAIPFAIGATLTPLASTREASPRRTFTYLWALVWITLSVLLASLLSRDALSFAIIGITVSGIYGFACGLVGRISANARIIGVLSLVFFAIYLGSPETRLGALESTAMVALGGFLQIGVLTLLSLRREPPSTWAISAVTPSALQRLRDGLSWNEPYVRHALRLGSAMATGTALALFLAHTFSWPHQYWLPMTIAWILLPGAQATTTKTASRILGTFIGVGLIAIVVGVILGAEPSLLQSAVIAGFGAFLMLAFIFANYTATTIGITIFAMTIFTLVEDPLNSTLPYRLALTVMAGAIALTFAQFWRDESVPTQV